MLDTDTAIAFIQCYGAFFIMILLIILGVALYFILPLLIVMWLLEKNDYMIFGWDADILLVGWGVVFIELAFFVQILSWTGFL